MRKVWFWQLIISPHMADLIKALADMEVSVTLVVQQEMSVDRAAQGWVAPNVGKVKLIKAENAKLMKSLAEAAPVDTIHICQGIRGNGAIREVQKVLNKLGRKQFVVMETVEDSGWKGYIKRFIYWYLFKKLKSSLVGVLATGTKTKDWVIARGVNPEVVFPFAYFLPDNLVEKNDLLPRNDGFFRILFVGRLIELKQLDLLIKAISMLESKNVKLAVVGSGPLEKKLQEKAKNYIPNQVEWIGQLPISEVRKEMIKSDCLVLPSRHDGWGAVISEALMSGTPAICSDACGAACVIPRGRYGDVFEAGNLKKLVQVLEENIRNGKLTLNEKWLLANWASCLGAKAGANYLLEILNSIENTSSKPVVPWQKKSIN